MERRPIGFRLIGNLYRFARDLETNDGTRFKAGEMAVCVGARAGRLSLVTRDGRHIRRVSLSSVELVQAYDYECFDAKHPFAHIGSGSL